MNSIKKIRSYTGLSQAKFSQKYNIPTRTVENWESGSRKCPEYLIQLLSRVVQEDFKKYLVEYAYAENYVSVGCWETIGVFIADSAEDAAKIGANADGLERALFRVFRMVPDQFGGMEKTGSAEYFDFG